MAGGKQISVMAVVALAVAVSSAQLQTSHAPVKVAALSATARVVARVNGVPITQDAFDREMQRVFPYFGMHGNAVPKEYEEDVRKKALNDLIDTELMYQEAIRRKLQITAAERQKRLAEIRSDYRSEAEFQAEMKRLFGSRAAFEAKLRHDMLLDKLYLLEIKNKSDVTELEVRKLYQANRANFVQPEAVTYQTISAMFPKNPTAADRQAARQRIEQYLAQAKAANTYERFGVLAEKISEDEYRVMMGEHKMVHRGAIAREFEFVFGMQAAQVSGIVESSAGFHIVRLEKHSPATQLSYAQVRGDLRKSMEQERLDKRNRAFHQALRKTAKIVIVQG